MSYCVNCGVELDATAKACPLCHTKVYNPKQPVATDLPTPYATVKGYSEPVKAKEFTIIMTIVLLTTALVCGCLNLFAIPIGRWSLYVAGICAVLWIFLIPMFFPQKISIYFQTAFDGISIALFLALISLIHPNNHWYLHIGLPVTALGTILLEIIFLFSIHLKSAMLIKALISVSAIAIFCIAIEISIDLHLHQTMRIHWSAIVATCAAAIDIILLTIYLREGLRREIRRRMHF